MINQPPLFKTFNIWGGFSKKLPKSKILEFFPNTFFPKQIHSDKIIILESLLPSFSLEGDAVITEKKGIIVGIQTADCVPILIAHKKGAIVGAVHAGWRGTLNQILFKTLMKIISRGYHPQELLVALGPHIQGTCYTVGEEVIERLPIKLRKPPYLIKRENNYFLSLSALNLYQAESIGLKRENIHLSSHCTHCLSEKYHSYRKEKNLDFTQVSLIKL